MSAENKICEKCRSLRAKKLCSDCRRELCEKCYGWNNRSDFCNDCWRFMDRYGDIESTVVQPLN